MTYPLAAASGVERKLTSDVLAGRHDELAALRAALDRPPGLVVVDGEAGVGKTRLVREVLAGLVGPLVLWGGCLQQREPPPYFAVVEALRDVSERVRGRHMGERLFGALRPLMPEWASWLPPRPESLEDPRAERHQLLRALRTLLETLGPAVLVLDDVHWADESTLDLLRYLARNPPAGLVVVVTCRREQVRDNSPLAGLLADITATATWLHLRALDVDQVQTLVEGLLAATEVSREFVQFVHAQTGGLPFAVEELVQLMCERRQLVQVAGEWLRPALEVIVVPPALAERTRGRLAALSESARRVVEAAAVAGLPVDEAELSELVGSTEPAAEVGLGEAIHARLLVAAGNRFTTRHALTRTVIEDSMLPGSRRRLHRLAAQVLAQRIDTPAGVLAEHYRAAGDIEAWLRYGEQAADDAVAVYDDCTACRIVLDLLRTNTLSAEVHTRLARKLGEVAPTAREYRSAADAIRDALDRHGIGMSRAERGVLLFQLARLLVVMGDRQGACEAWAQTVAELGDDHPLAVRAMCWLAIPDVTTETARQHGAWLARAARAVAAMNEPATALDYLLAKSTAELCIGRTSGWTTLQHARDRVSSHILLRRQLAVGLVNAAEATFYLGHYAHAGKLADEAQALIGELGYDHMLDAVMVVQAWIDFAVGHWAGLLDRVTALLARTAEAPSRHTLVQLLHCLLRHIVAEQDVADSQATLGASATTAWTSSDLPTAVQGSAVLARQQLDAGRLDEAYQAAAGTVEMLASKGVWSWAGEPVAVLVEALLRRDDLAQARRLTDRFARGLQGMDAPVAAAHLLFCRALLATRASAPAAARRWLAVADAFAALPRPYDAALARERAGRLLMGASPAQGTGLLLDAAAELDALGAATDSRRVRSALQDHGVELPYPWRGGRRSYGDVLSPREREVVVLVAQQLSNAEIASRLSVSADTVKSHIRTAMRKQKVHRRADLAVQ